MSLYIVKNTRDNSNQKTLPDLSKALSYAQKQNESVAIYEMLTGNMLYEFSPSTGLKQFLVD